MTENRRFGIVVIGRNEGDRLERCLSSVIAQAATIVYVDSSSTDGSVSLAKKIGAEVVELDTSMPFTAARARNAGFDRLRQLCSDVEYVFFIDGDCEMERDWLDTGYRELERHHEAAIVCGRVCERHPEASIYNRLANMEWNSECGETDSTGGIFMIRTGAFEQVGGFNPQLIAGEESELCVRLRRNGWKILRIDAKMALHDAEMTHFSQWWRRAVRDGHAYAEGAALHGQSPARHCVRETRSNWFWGLLYPLTLLIAAWPTSGWSLLGSVVYALMVWRVARSRYGLNDSWSDAWLYGVFVMLGKLPSVVGQIYYWMNQLRRRQSPLIEYK